jgi:hypothetical protein
MSSKEEHVVWFLYFPCSNQVLKVILVDMSETFFSFNFADFVFDILLSRKISSSCSGWNSLVFEEVVLRTVPGIFSHHLLF